jgi:hypothetical protein
MSRFANLPCVVIAVCSFCISANAFSMEDTHYAVTRDESKQAIKRVVEVVLDERVDQPTLEELANQIKESNPTTYERTFIGWRIKGEESGAYWAKTDFVPLLEVKFLGSTVEEYKTLKTASSKVDGKVFGTWLSTWGTDYKMVGYRKGKNIFIRFTFTGGESSTKAFLSKKVAGKSVLVDAQGSDFNEFYLVNAQGDLEFWGENGSFYTAKKVD